MKIRNKKAQFFTLMVISLIALLFLSYSVYSYSRDRKAISTRIRTMDNFLFSLEQDLERQMYVFGFRAIFLAEDEIARRGTYISNITDFFEEAFFEGTVYGNSSDILIGVYYNDLLENINEKSGKINVNISILNPRFKVIQQDPWNVVFIFSFNISMSDKSGLASWNKEENITSFVSIEGFEDPTYLLNTNGKVSNMINKSAYTFSSDISNLSLHVENSYYVSSLLAPSFLQRLEGNLQANENGIESLVYIPKLSLQGVQVKDKSCVDYIYFSSNNPSSSNIIGMPSWFKLDNEHFSVYGVSA